MWFKTVLACFRLLPCSKGAEWGVAHIPASSFSSFASPACPSLESNWVFGQGGRSGAVVCWWLFNTSSLENIPWFVVFAHFPGVNALCHLLLPWLISSQWCWVTTRGVGRDVSWSEPTPGWRIEGWFPLEWAQVQAALRWLPLPFWLTPVVLMSLVGWVCSGSQGFSSAPAHRWLNFSSTLAPATGAQFRASCWWGPSQWWGVLASYPGWAVFCRVCLTSLETPHPWHNKPQKAGGLVPCLPCPALSVDYFSLS